MNMLFLISSLTYGGAEKQAVIDANLLSKNHKVFLGVFKDGPLKSQVSDKVNVLFIKKENYIATALGLAKLNKKHNIQAIYASLFAAMNIAALSTLFYKTNVIWSFHSHEYDIPFKSRISFQLLSRLKSVKKIIFVTNELKEFFESSGFNFPGYKTEIIYNSASFSRKDIIRNARNNKIVIGYVGRVVGLKRLHYLVELVEFLLRKSFDNFEIHIVGDGEKRTELEKLINEKGLSKYIKFFGFNADTKPFYCRFDIFVNPSGEECLSIALIDAGISGIPSVVFDAGGNNEVVYNDKTGFVVTGKDEFFEKILLLCNDKNLRLEMGAEAVKYCNKNFNTAVRLKNLERIAEKCIKV